MKLVSLNVYGGKFFKPLMEFLKEQAKDADIFCFQEMLNAPQGAERQEGKSVQDLFQRCAGILSEFEGFFDSVEENWVEDMKAPWGLATFVRRTIPLSERGEFFVFRERNTMEKQNPSTIPRLVQYAKFAYNSKQFTLCNFHGLYSAGSKKLDTPDRIEQCKRVRDYLNRQSGAKILCGDFNLAQNTESLRMLEKEMRNLITEYGITSTRSSMYYRNYATETHFGDYVIVSPEVQVSDFSVPNIHISDHLPLIMEFY